MGFMDGLLDVLSGPNAVKQIDQQGFDFREKRRQEELARQQQQEQWQQANEQYGVKLGTEAMAGAPEGETPDVSGLFPGADQARRKLLINAMVGAGQERKSNLEAIKANRDLQREFMRNQGRLDVVGATGANRIEAQKQAQGYRDTQQPSPRDEAGWKSSLDRTLAAIAARGGSGGGGGGGARKPYWNVKEKRTDFLTNEEVGSVPQGTYTDVVTGRSQANSGNEGMSTIVQNLDDALANYEQSQKGVGMLVPSSMNVAWDRYRSALQSAGQIFGRQFLKDTRVSEQDREAYAKTIGQPNRWLTVLDPGEARRRLNLIKEMTAKYPGVGETGGGAEAGGGGMEGGETAVVGGVRYRLKPGANRKLKSSWEPIQ